MMAMMMSRTSELRAIVRMLWWMKVVDKVEFANWVAKHSPALQLGGSGIIFGIYDVTTHERSLRAPLVREGHVHRTWQAGLQPEVRRKYCRRDLKIDGRASSSAGGTKG